MGNKNVAKKPRSKFQKAMMKNSAMRSLMTNRSVVYITYLIYGTIALLVIGGILSSILSK